MKRPLNERKENVWKGRKATRALDCRVFLSFCMGDAFSTNGQWLHWIVLEEEREGKIKLVCGGRKKNMMGKKKKEERLREIARGGGGRGYYHLNRVGSFPFIGDLPSYRP